MTKALRIFGLSVLTFIVVAFSDFASHAQMRQNSARPSPKDRVTPVHTPVQSKLSDEDVATIANAVAKSVKGEAARDSRAASAEVDQHAKETQDRADRLQSLIAWVSSAWLVVVSLLFGVILFFGWQEGSTIRTTKQEANALIDQANALLKEARASSIQVALSGETAREAASQAGKSAERSEAVRGRRRPDRRGRQQ
jgi:hypothetical protein